MPSMMTASNGCRVHICIINGCRVHICIIAWEPLPLLQLGTWHPFAFPTQTLYLRREEWTGPQPAGADYAEARSNAVAAAMKAAAKLTKEGVGDEIPLPVQFDKPPEQDAGGAGE